MSEENWRDNVRGISSFTCSNCKQVVGTYLGYRQHLVECEKVTVSKEVVEGFNPLEYLSDDNQLELDLDKEIVEKDKIDRVDLTRDIQDYRDKLENEFMENTSNVYHTSYYKLDKEDLYSIFIKKFGFQAWLRHVEMECIQYLWRAKDKGVYKEDINKVKVICERILAELKENS